MSRALFSEQDTVSFRSLEHFPIGLRHRATPVIASAAKHPWGTRRLLRRFASRNDSGGLRS
jgi:hypothetical protein